jgi:hypothetical protein
MLLFTKGCNRLIDLFRDLAMRVIFKATSGKFIFTVVVAAVYAKLALGGIIAVERVQEITLVVLYAYFTRKENGSAIPEKKDSKEKHSEDPIKESEKTDVSA